MILPDFRLCLLKKMRIKSFLVFLLLSMGSMPSAFSFATDHHDSIQEAVLYIFTGSDWCANCRRLEKNVLSDSVFIKAMDSAHVRIEIIDFPQRKKQSPETIAYNSSKSEQLGFNGNFPTLKLSFFRYSGRTPASTTVTFIYKKQDARELSGIILQELKQLNE
jgi:thiol-disulfide isomerase/thioredoxin